MTTTLNVLSAPARSFLDAVAAAPAGLSETWMWEGGRRGFAGPDGDAFRECLYAGLLEHALHRFVLTDAGAEHLGLTGYTGNDPSTWDDKDAEALFVRGYCHALAVALHRSHGFDLVVLADRGNRPWHVFVQDDDEVPYDFDGATNRERMVNDTGVGKHRFVRLASEADLRRYIGGHNRLRDLPPSIIAMAERYIAGRPDKYPALPAPSP